MATIRPLDDRVVLKVLDAEEVSAGGIVLPDAFGLAALDRTCCTIDHRREGHRGGIAPQPFESVELTLLVKENVDHEIDVVEQHPLALAQAFDVSGLPPGLTRQTSFDTLDDRGDLATRGSVADDERVRHVGESTQVERDHVLGFSITRGFHTKQNGVVRLVSQVRAPLTYKLWR